VSVGGISRIVSASDGHLVVPKFARHEWRRAVAEDGASFEHSWDDEELVVQEWTDPFDGEKEIFFRNLNSVIIDTIKNPTWWMEWWLSLQLFVVFADADNYPVFWAEKVGNEKMQFLVTHFVLAMTKTMGRLVGAKGTYEEYTPEELRKKMK
jgi:hypothetical protein